MNESNQTLTVDERLTRIERLLNEIATTLVNQGDTLETIEEKIDNLNLSGDGFSIEFE